MTDPTTWTPAEINEYYDQHPDLLLADFARMTGKPVRELKKILMPEPQPRRVSDVYKIGNREYYRNKAGRCIDAPCCGCCTI